MAIFKKGALLVDDVNAHNQITYGNLVEDENIERYWGEDTQIIFKITNPKLDALFDKAKNEHKEVALIVKHIEDPKKVSARWGIFDEKKAKKYDNYYVLDEKIYDDKGHKQFLESGIEVKPFKAFKKDYVCAIIGSEVRDGNTLYKVYFHPGGYIFQYVTNPMIGPGGGGGGGVEIPP